MTQGDPYAGQRVHRSKGTSMRAGEASFANGRRPDGSVMGCAIVLGAPGRVGTALASRLARDGVPVVADPCCPATVARATPGAYLFDCAYRDGDPEGHVARVAGHLAHWRDYAGIFVPSSDWIDTEHAYGRSKRVVEELAAFYRLLGANVVTDRIGYFPGDGVAADPSEPMIARLVDGDALYARIMAALLAPA